MINVIVEQNFFNRPTLIVAQELLGKHLVRRINKQVISLKIHEVEAYDGPHDRACHAAKGRTKRTEIMFGPAGHFYVYFVYGIHWMLNIVVGSENYPAAILIRGAGHISGPARLTNFLSIDKQFNTLPVSKESNLWIEDHGITISHQSIQCTPRIGIDYAGSVWAQKPYRFILV